MKSKASLKNENNNICLKKRNGKKSLFNKNNTNTNRYNFFNRIQNRNKISIILSFLDINEQLPLLYLNSIISKILINKYNLPFKSIKSLREIKKNKNSIESKFSKIFLNFKNIIDNNDFNEEEYQYIISFLLKNVNNNFIIFDKINNNTISNEEIDKDNSNNKKISMEQNNLIKKKYEIFFEFLSKIKFIKNITHIKFILSGIDNEINDTFLKSDIINKFYFVNFFQNINHIEIDKIENSFYFINQLISFKNNSINNIEKTNLNDINIRAYNETLLNYDNYNSLTIPKITEIKYLFLSRVKLSIFCLNEIINKNPNLIKLVINNCSNNSFSLYDEEEYNILINKSLNNCKEITHIEFNNNKFSQFLTNKIISNLCELFFNINNKIYIISCGYPFNNIKTNNENNETNNLIDIPNCLKDCQNSIFSNNFNNKYLTVKFSSSLSYHIKKNKRIIELSNFLEKENDNIFNEIKYEKIKLCLYASDNFSISNNIKKIMGNYCQKNITKYFQMFTSSKNVEFTPDYNIKNKKDIYDSIEKFTIFFQSEDESITLFGNKLILAIITFFPRIKIISFKNINFQSDKQKFRENFDDINECFETMLFGKKNEDFYLFKNKKNCLNEIKFNNCYYYNNLINKDILKDIENKIYSYLGKKIIKISFVE